MPDPIRLPLTVRFRGEEHPVAAVSLGHQGRVWQIITSPARPFDPYFSIQGTDLDEVDLCVDGTPCARETASPQTDA